MKQAARAARIAVHACAVALLGFGAALAGAFASGALAQGTAVEGVDSARILAPAGTSIEPYANLGYELKVEDGEVVVRSDAQPLRSVASYRAPDFTDAERREPTVRLASTLTRGAHTQFDAASRILGWVSREIRYTYDRSVSQEAAAVLARRSGYCTGVARLTVALLRAAGLEAREVAGWIASSNSAEPAIYHRWVEIHYADRGWVFSDPLATHNWVPASYVRLASERVDASGLEGGLLLERRDTIAAVDTYADAGAVVRARRNEPRQRAGSLRVEVADGEAGTLTLEGDGRKWTSALQLGAAVFVGLSPGDYLLHVVLPGRPTLTRQIRMHRRVKSAIYFPPFARSSGVEGQSR